MSHVTHSFLFFFFNDTATTEIYTLSLHDALPITMATRKRTRRKPTWERAYRGHVLWLGKARLGRVTLADRGRYTWEAAGRTGAVDDLAKAKQAVEGAIATAGKPADPFR